MCTNLKKWGYKEAEHSGIAEAHICVTELEISKL